MRLRPARPDEEEALSRLCLKSKAYWGYDAAFMAAVSPYLKVTSQAIEAGFTTVAETGEGTLLGVCQIEPGGEHGSLDLLFVAPEAIGTGAGRALFEHAKQQLRAKGETVMTILSDPYAEPAYLHMGAKRVEMRPSDVFEGRKLPWLEVAL
ncbi:GNAT family N-acetyltransferase [Maricaulis sp.]|jgi:GNAT superfamily N-acetyltransferase|uniref:GNAT family N-acetyltransferase n=1 Tax=Maricaulis sp. TaxID=1486257 RepID=UPI002604BF8F|nr:GNAT family N-acetyltransferase [Maricaulis sp.]